MTKKKIKLNKIKSFFLLFSKLKNIFSTLTTTTTTTTTTTASTTTFKINTYLKLIVKQVENRKFQIDTLSFN